MHPKIFRSSNSVRSIFSPGSFYGSAGCLSASVFWKTRPCCRRLICYDRSSSSPQSLFSSGVGFLSRAAPIQLLKHGCSINGISDPLRLINFAVAASVTATFLKYLNRWEAPLRPFLLIGRHMLPVFCSQICLSVLLIGRTESGLTIEPITSALVICQLLTAPLFAWFLELRSVAKQSTRPIPPALGAKQHISLAETRMKRHPLPSRTVRQPVLHPL